MPYTVETSTRETDGAPVIVRSNDDTATGAVLLVALLVLVSLIVAYSVNLGNMQSIMQNSSVHNEPQQVYPVAIPGPQGTPGPQGASGAPGPAGAQGAPGAQGAAAPSTPSFPSTSDSTGSAGTQPAQEPASAPQNP